MKKIGPVLGITGGAAIAVSQFMSGGHIPGSNILFNLGALLVTFGFLPYLLLRGWKELAGLQKLERFLGVAGTFLLVNGLLFKFMRWPGQGILMIAAVLLLIFGYIPLQLHLEWGKAKTLLQKSHAVARFGLFFFILSGFIFKIMHWPGAGLALIISLFVLPAYLLLYFVLRFRGQGKIPFMVGDLLLTILAYFIWIFVNSITISTSIMESFLFIEDQYIQINTGIETSNNLIYESIDSMSAGLDDSLVAAIMELRQLGNSYISSSDSIKKGLYNYCLGQFYEEGANHHWLFYGDLASAGLAEGYFIVHKNGYLIRDLIDDFRKGVLQIADQYQISSGVIGLGLETKDFLTAAGHETPWVYYFFERQPLATVIVNLSYFKQMALLTESAVLNGVLSQVDLSDEARLLQDMAARESKRAIELKENEISRVKQQQAIQEAQLEKSLLETQQNRVMAITGFSGVALVLVLFTISTRAFLRKQRDNRKLAEQKKEIENKNEELNQQNDEIAAQRDEIEAQRDTVFKQKEQIEKTHEEISSSIDYAKRLQGSILPNTSLLERKFSDHMVFFRPKQKVSGDFYWWSEVEDRVVVTAVDCTGHGVPGAFMSMLGVSLLREIVNREYITHPGVILNRLRKEVIRSLDQRGHQNEQKDGMDMALLSIDPETLKCEYAGANNPLYMVRNGSLQEYKPDRMPISYYPRLDKFTCTEIQLQKGDQLYLFSDGFADQFGGERRKKFKYQHFKQILIEHSRETMQRQHDILLDAIIAWQGEQEQVDDMVIIGVKI